MARQLRAFLRINSAQLIKDHERAVIDLLEDADDICDVTAECAERLLDRLFIADVCIDHMETRQLRAALHGDVQSALRHECEQANCFE
jgi:hypothetical protein